MLREQRAKDIPCKMAVLSYYGMRMLRFSVWEPKDKVVLQYRPAQKTGALPGCSKREETT
jgi:hypothetical protein